MSLYRFFAKAGMPSIVPSLSDKEIENANASVKKLQEKEVKSGHTALALCARVYMYVYVYTYLWI